MVCCESDGVTVGNWMLFSVKEDKWDVKYEDSVRFGIWCCDPAATTADKGFSWLEFWGGRTSECGQNADSTHRNALFGRLHRLEWDGEIYSNYMLGGWNCWQDRRGYNIFRRPEGEPEVIYFYSTVKSVVTFAVIDAKKLTSLPTT